MITLSHKYGPYTLQKVTANISLVSLKSNFNFTYYKGNKDKQIKGRSLVYRQNCTSNFDGFFT